MNEAKEESFWAAEDGGSLAVEGEETAALRMDEAAIEIKRNENCFNCVMMDVLSVGGNDGKLTVNVLNDECVCAHHVSIYI